MCFIMLHAIILHLRFNTMNDRQLDKLSSQFYQR